MKTGFYDCQIVHHSPSLSQRSLSPSRHMAKEAIKAMRNEKYLITKKADSQFCRILVTSILSFPKAVRKFANYEALCRA